MSKIKLEHLTKIIFISFVCISIFLFNFFNNIEFKKIKAQNMSLKTQLNTLEDENTLLNLKNEKLKKDDNNLNINLSNEKN